ncbi:T9SS type A sorting domain-containing protein [Lacibacter luteus]|uniref:T9SS type A sorting domain-containing protein n=1 Tax=Lacibacter luteus TaxID=2508719 RepID=A0A4Q1CKM2_9BACT|nr:T9SS type A sorting domain-containing protein [Lacibacter luteus]RXK61507.1 T9SS type A sorting domain-containing protein [Lacibacter luteus]
MKENFLLSAFLFIALSSAAQKSSFVYMISAPENQASWLNIELMNSKKGELVQTIYDYRKQHAAVVDIETNQQRTTTGNALPTTTTVAAAAYDGKTQRMFFIPMRVAELRWADVRTPAEAKYYTTSSAVLNELNLNDPANHITRMVIGADGYGYAITNDGNHLYRFTTGKKPQLTDLGNLVDAAANGAMSVHSQCSSWGGDVVAGTDGLLYLISQRQQVFSIDPETRITTNLGTIKGLPENFTVNGAAVNDEGMILLSCSYGNQPFYQIELDQLQAKLAFTKDQRINASDLASSNLALRPAINNGQYVQGRSPFETANQKISMYPNPVTEYRFQLNFEETTTGIHTIQVMDISGKLLLNKIVNISGPGQFEGVELNKKISKGMYFVKVLNSELKAVYTSKFILQ